MRLGEKLRRVRQWLISVEVVAQEFGSWLVALFTNCLVGPDISMAKERQSGLRLDFWHFSTSRHVYFTLYSQLALWCLHWFADLWISSGQETDWKNNWSKACELFKRVLHTSAHCILFFFQIAGSHRGSYWFHLISEIAGWSRICRCRLVSQACLPSWSPFWAALGCRCRLVSQLVPLHDFPSGLLLAAASVVSQLVCLHDFPFGLLLVATAALSPKHFPSGLPLLVSQLVSQHRSLHELHDFPSGTTLGCRCRQDLPSLFLFMISRLGCSWLQLPPCLSACFPFWFPFWAALGCRCRRCLPSLSPFMISLLGCSWLPLPPCLQSLFLFMISRVGCSWLPLVACLQLVSLHGGAAAAFSPSLLAFMIFVLGCSWLPLPPSLPVSQLVDCCRGSYILCPR